MVGQIGQYIGSLWLTGSDNDYLQSRFLANQNPEKGDGGSDILGLNVDFKASLMRNKSMDILSYRLPVRPRERHDDWIYVLVLVSSLKSSSAVAHLVGWLFDEELPERPETRKPFDGAYVVRAKDLHPILPFNWLRNEIRCCSLGSTSS